MDPALGLLMAVSLAILLMSAGAHKLYRLAWFDEVVRGYGFAWPMWGVRFHRALPPVEIIIGLGLLVGGTRPYAAVAAALLVLSYAAVIEINLRHGRKDVECGCSLFGAGQPIARWMVWRNGLIAVPAILIALPWRNRPLELTDIVTIAGSAFAITLVYHCIEYLVGNGSRAVVKWRSSP